ncbi:hypothetical protein F652_1821 [Enterobacteriaceae bacterium bta3-1]|nr:hypothetical protein F652_1821 [Enterobacteriaceae bacterium bta3-1]
MRSYPVHKSLSEMMLILTEGGAHSALCVSITMFHMPS